MLHLQVSPAPRSFFFCPAHDFALKAGSGMRSLLRVSSPDTRNKAVYVHKWNQQLPFQTEKQILFDENYNYIKKAVNRIDNINFSKNREYYIALIYYGEKYLIEQYILYYDFGNK